MICMVSTVSSASVRAAVFSSTLPSGAKLSMAVMPWGTVLEGMTTTVLGVRASTCWGGHDDVLIVGQDKDGLGGNLVHRLQDVLGAGVHGLAAGNDLIDAQILEHVRKTRAGADGDDAQRLLRLCDLRGDLLLGEYLLGMLQTHVLDLHRDEGAVVQRLGQRLAGIVGMDMHLDNLVVVHQYEAVAPGSDRNARRFSGSRSFSREIMNSVQ